MNQSATLGHCAGAEKEIIPMRSPAASPENLRMDILGQALRVLIICLLALLYPRVGTCEVEDCDTTGLSPILVDQLLNQRFASLLRPQAGNNLGTFAALDVKDAQAALTGSIRFTGGSILSFNAVGSAIGGFVPIFDGNEFAPRISFEMQYHALALANQVLRYDNIACRQYQAETRRIEAEYKQKLADIDPRMVRSRHASTLQTLRVEQKALIELQGDVKTRPIQHDSLDVELIKNALSYEAALADSARPTPEAVEIIEKWRTDEVGKASVKFETLGYGFGWLSVSGKLENSTFRLFRPDSAFASQVEKRSYVSYSARLQYSHYNLSTSPYGSSFWSVGVAGGYSNNLSDLATVDITETKSFGPNPTDRISTKKYTAYQGAYEEDLQTLDFTADYYRFLFSEETGALHAYPHFRAQRDQRPVANLGLGILVIARSKDRSNRVNSELYLDLIDLWNVRDSEDGLLERSTVGLRFTFPIDFGR